MHRAEQEQGQAQMERLEKQAARIDAFLKQHEPQRGQRGTALQRHVTDNDAATRPTAHGGIQGSNGQAFGEA
jgi:hypothetical protein